jgi:ribonuclease P protein component
MSITPPDIIRIKKRRDFVAAASKGNKVVATTLVLQGFAPPEAATNTLRVGFTVTKKVGNAVVRNRIRRRLKAAASQLFAENGRSGWDYVVIGRARALDESFDIILRDLRYAIRKTGKLEDAKHAETGMP